MRRGGSSNGDDSDSDDFARPEPPALHHPLPEAPTTPQQAAEAEQSERTGAQGDSAGDESNTCPICFDLWTISGPHQLVALKCGHLFGQSCIRKWITQGNRRHGQRMANRDKGKCPECNQPAARRDMRHIFARSITAVDDERLAETQAEVKKLKDRQGVLETDLAHYQMSFQQMRNEVVKLRNELKESFTKSQWLELENENLKKHTSELADRLRRRCSLARAHTDSMSSVDNATSPGRTGVDRMAGAAASTGSNDSDVDVINAVGAEAILRSTYCPRLRLKAVIPLAVQAGESSRLLAHHPYDHLLYASYSKRSLKFHTLAQINVDDPASPPYMLKALHMDEIRGAEASPHNTGTQYMLTASMDQTAALTSLGCAPSSVGPSSCYAIGAPKRANPMLASRLKLGAQGWSCAWDTADPNLCYAGTAGGRVLAFDLRRTSSPVHTWDGPHDGAVPHTSRRLPAADHQQQQQQKMATGFSPIHGISVIPCQSSSDSARQLTRLVVANSQHLYSLPPMPDRLALADLNASKEATATAQSKEWTRLTGNDGSGGLHSRSCYSVSFDARLNCLAASFRAQDASRVPVTIHELYDVDFNGSSSVWRLRQQVTVNSPQNKWARSTIFSYQPQGPHGRWQGLFCAGVEATRSVRVWDACAQAASELLTLNDVPSPEDIVDVKGWQWSTADSTAVFSTLTNSVVRLYDVR
ncbi:hypothetical protein GQ54DRAFT_258181 [Martensiomyces pterosporus]|nr:hypothetical protein GQ54DRAFT_258181 [Martensiomyces pterosporus]